jgi:hypothetical protein
VSFFINQEIFMSIDTRVPTTTMVARLLRHGLTPQTHPQAHTSFETAFEAIRQADALRWQRAASAASVAKAQSLGAQLGWIPREYHGAPQVFKSMQIDFCAALDRMDAAQGPAKNVAAEALIAEVRRHLTRPVMTDARQRVRREAVRVHQVTPAETENSTQ